MEREKFKHSKYPIYESYLVPILSWDEIYNEIITKYSDPKEYSDKHDVTEIDELTKNQTDKFGKVTKNDLENTLKYLFDSYKEFLYFSFRDGKIKAKYHIYNRNSINEWYKNLSPIEGNNFNDFFKIAKSKVKGLTLEFAEPKKWYANNCIVRMENWGDKYGMPNSYLIEILEIFEYCMSKYNLPDCDFILNRKDFALLTSDNSNAYYSLYPKAELNKQPKICFPTLSQSGRKQTLDIIIPTSDDWKHLSNLHKMKINTVWTTKKNVGVWRGSTTGCGTTKENNPRIKLAYVSDKLKKDGYKKLDIGLTQFTKGFRVNDGIIDFVNIQKINLPKYNFITFEEQSNYKYIFNIEGNTAAYRFSSLFSMNSVVINIKSKFKLWFEPLLEKNKHYISLSYDFDEHVLKKTIDYLNGANDVAKYIADNGKQFFDKYITKDIIAEYWLKIMIGINEKQIK